MEEICQLRLERWVQIHRLTKKDDIPGKGIELSGGVRDWGRGKGRHEAEKELRPLMGAPI